jgi:Tol biopolymer transport system component
MIGDKAPSRLDVTLVAFALGIVSLIAACSGGSGTAETSGERIAFGKYDPALRDHRIWTAAADGSDERPLVEQVSWMSDWAPDGTRLVFEDTTTLTTIAPDGSDARVLVDSLGFQATPKWSPTGEWIAFGGSEETPSDLVDVPYDFETSVWVVRADGTGLRRVSDEHDVEPVFSPDGSQLAFGHVTKPAPVPQLVVQSLVLVNLDGTGRREVVPPTQGLQHVDWSPDGEWIIYNISPWDGVTDQPPERGSLYAVRPDGSDRHVLVPATDEWVFAKPVWSPDGEAILAVCFPPSGGYDRLCVVDIEDARQEGEARVLIDHPSDIPASVNFPSWGSAPDS